MNIKEFKDRLKKNADDFFHQKNIQIVEKRGIIIETRINFNENVFLEIYFNSLNQKTSYALISNSIRIFGCDNYKFWHVHPFNKSTEHIECQEPSMEELFSENKNHIQTL